MSGMVRIIDGTPVPYSLKQFRDDLFEGTGHRPPSGVLPPEFLAEYDVYLPPDAPLPVVGANQEAALRGLPDLVGGEWVYLWDVTDKSAQELADELAAWREAEVVSRTQFASACFIAGIITGQEARDWAGGNALPANVEAAIVAAISDPAEQVVALTKAGAEIDVRRNNVLIDILAADASFDMSDVEVDQIFALAKWVD